MNRYARNNPTKINKTIIIDGQRIDYQVIYKAIKRIYLRVDQGQLVISCPIHTSDAFIEKMIKENFNKLQKAILDYKPMAIYEPNGYVYFLGKKYRIQLIDMKIKKMVIKEDRICVYHHQIEQVCDRYFREYLYQYLVSTVAKYVQKDSRLPMPQIELKKTKRRYGACYYKKNLIRFNSILIHHSTDFIDYVVVHELCHFIEPNHSKQFYKEVEKLMPNYKNIIREEKYANHIDQ